MSLLSKILTPPKSKYTDYYELAKYELTWKIITIISITLAVLTIAYSIFDFQSFFPALYGLFTAILLNYLFYKSQNYRLFGMIYVFHSIVFLGLIMIMIPDVIHVIEYVWFFIFTLFAFFILGNKIGFLTVVLNMTFLSIYFVYFFERNIELITNNINSFQVVSTILNLAFGFSLVGFLVSQFKVTRKHADTKFKEVYLEVTQKNRMIQAQNEEKTIMLKEIHHRVKNNLQVISSLIRLQSFETEDVEAKKMFDATVNRVVAMALIHEKMYQKDNLSKLNIADYLRDLASDLIGSYGIQKKIDFSIHSDFEIIGNRTIVPLALIFNELISNSLKHAFKTLDIGKISVSIVLIDSDFFKITYIDNGIWVGNTKESSFGTELIHTFTEQLDGEVRRDSNDKGTTYTFKLKNIE